MLAEAIASQTFIVYMPSSTGVSLKAYRFKPSIYKQLFNSDASLKPKDETQPGRHHLLSILYEGKRFWLKFTPEQPGTEFAINRLERYLGGQNTPMTQIIKISHGKNPGMAIQVSEHVSGSTLEEALKEAPESVCKIDMTSFTETLLRVLLTNPEDDKDDDYFLVPIEHSNYFRLMRIDNERAYYQPDALTGVIIKTKKLEVKSALYCLNQMQEPLSPDILEAFTRLDPLSLLDRWMQELKEEHAHHRALFTDNEVKQHFHNVHPSPSILGVPMGSGLSEELLTRLESIQEVIRLKGIHCVNGIDLLKAVQPQLAEYYEKGFKEHPAPDSSAKHTDAAQCVSNRLETINRLYNITPHGHRQSMLPTIKAASKSLRLKKDLTENDVIHCIHSEALSPQKALDELHQLEEKRVDDIKKALLDETSLSIGEFRKLRVRLRLLLLKEIIDEITTTSNISISQQKHLLKAMAGTPFHSLSLTAFHAVLTDGLLQPLLASAHKHLLVLDISRCDQLTEKSFKTLSERCPHLETLIAEDIKKNKYFLSFNNLMFFNLKTVIMNRCEPLTHLHLQAPLLEKLEASECPQLESVVTSSLTLFSTQLAKTPALTERGVEHLSHLPFRLQRLNLTDCSQVSYADFRTRFPLFGTQHVSLLSNIQIEILSDRIKRQLTDNHWTAETLPEPLKEHWVNAFDGWLTGHASLSMVPAHLVKALKDVDTDVRKNACHALRQLTAANPTLARQLLNSLWTVLKDKNRDVRDAASHTLKQLTATNPSHQLFIILSGALQNRDRNNEYRYMGLAACQALGQLGVTSPTFTPQLLDSLLSVLQHHNGWDVREAACHALGQLGAANPTFAPQLLEPLLEALQKNLYIEKAASYALGQLVKANPSHAPQLLDPLLKTLRDESSSLRTAACHTLGQLVTASPTYAPQLLEPLLRTLQDRYSEVQTAACHALGQLGAANPTFAPQLLDPLLKTLRDESSSLRTAACHSLGQLVTASPTLAPQFLDPLLRALQDRYSEVQTAACHALGQLVTANPTHAPQLLNPLLTAVQDKKDSGMRKAICHTLKQLVTASPTYAPQLFESLLKALQDNAPSVRKTASHALGQLVATSPTHAAQLLDPLLKALQKGWYIREAACHPLGQLAATYPSHAAQLLNPLLRAMQDINWGTQKAACHALGQLAATHPAHAAQLLNPLLKTLQDKGPHMQTAACHALEQLVTASPTHAPQLFEPLSSALQDESSSVRTAACHTLGQLVAVHSASIATLIQRMCDDLNKRRSSKTTKDTAIQMLGEIIKALTIPNLLQVFENAIHDHTQHPDTSSFDQHYKHHGFLKPPIDPSSMEQQETSDDLQPTQYANK